jgi:lambda family phage portal protein
MGKPRIRVLSDGTVPAQSGLAELGLKPMASSFLGYSKRDAARHDLSEMSGWRPQIDFAGSSYRNDWETVTGRARSLDENNGWVNGGLDRRVESVIGENIRLSAQPSHVLLNRDYEWRMGWTADVQERFKVWANDIHHRNDVRKKLTFGAQARLAYLTYVRDGSAAVEIRDLDRGIRNPTAVLLVEPERIETPPEMKAAESPRLRDGIAFDANGAPIGYWVRNGHPNDPLQNFEGTRYTFVPAEGRTGRARFVHVFSPRRIEQNIGISKLAEVMLPAKMLDRVDRAEVNAALKSAIFSLFIKAPGTSEDIAASLAPSGGVKQVDPWISAYVDQRKKNPIVVDGAQVNHLYPDEDVVTPDASHPNSNYPDFARFILQKVASSLGISYPQISQDYAGINYSSARTLLNEIWRGLKQDRVFFCQHLLTPIYSAWLEWEVANGDVKVPGGPANFYRNKTAICMAEWIGPGRGSVDPKKEADANNLDEAAGRKSVVESILENGRDPSDVLAEEAWYIQERERRGLAPVNRNVKAAAAGADGESEGGGTADDRDGDGQPNESERRRRGAQPEGAEG